MSFPTFSNCELEQQRVSHPLKLNSEGELVTENCFKTPHWNSHTFLFRNERIFENCTTFEGTVSAQKCVTLFELADTDFWRIHWTATFAWETTVQRLGPADCRPPPHWAMASTPAAPPAAAGLPTLSQQVVTAVDQALCDRVMGSLKVFPHCNWATTGTASCGTGWCTATDTADVEQKGTDGEADVDPHWSHSSPCMCTGRLCHWGTVWPEVWAPDAHWECTDPDEPDCTACPP